MDSFGSKTAKASTTRESPAREFIIQALQIANNAVQADNAHDYRVALTLYEQVINVLESDTVSNGKSDVSDKLLELVSSIFLFSGVVKKINSFLFIKSNGYSERLDYLKHCIYPQQSRVPVSNLLIDQVYETNPTAATSQDKMPDKPERRPFWLMRILQKTMTSGGYITSKLYVPRNLW